jgi:hypothetical protein
VTGYSKNNLVHGSREKIFFLIGQPLEMYCYILYILPLSFQINRYKTCKRIYNFTRHDNTLLKFNASPDATSDATSI